MTTHFEEEIRSQGAVLRARAAAGAKQAELVANSWGSITHALVAARGSSDNAARYFQYVAGQECGLLVALAAPSLFEGVRPMRLDGAGVLAISQSGRSPGMVEVVNAARSQGRPSAVLTNDPDSPLGRAAELTIDLAAGPERAIASTKTFSATWHSLSQLVGELRGEPLAGIDDLADLVDGVVDWALAASLPVELLDVARGLTFLGRGVGYAAASEAALKVREVTGVRAEAFSVADFLHGPIGADAEATATILLLTDEIGDAIADEVLATSRGLGAATVVIRPPGRRSAAADAEIVLPGASANWATGLAEVLVGQVLALRLGQRRGRAIDTSPVLNKVTLSA
ncbi:MAG TPA: SIS domain-containing protein [Acidimicrobiales bacterium]|nr:SIS domain-containing protein [Acidimicrobiales bacterium]